MIEKTNSHATNGISSIVSYILLLLCIFELLLLLLLLLMLRLANWFHVV